MALQVTDLLFLLFAIAFIVWSIANRSRPILDVFTYLIGGYFTTLALSAGFSADVGLSFKKLAGEAYLLALALMAREVLAKLDILRPTVMALIAAGTVASLIGTLTVAAFYLDKDSFLLTYFLHHYGSLSPGNYPRIHGTFIYPAMLCNFLTLSLLLTLAAQTVGWIGRSLFVPILILHAVTIAYTVTPGIGGAIFAVAVWLAVKDHVNSRFLRAKALALFGCLAALLFTLAAAFSHKPIPTSPYHFEFYGYRIDPTQRLLTWQGSFETFLADPLTGIGLGLGTANVAFITPSGYRQLLTDAHNVFLSVAGQSGLPALLLLVLLIGLVVKRSFPWRSDAADTASTIRTTLGIAFVSAFVVQGLVGSFENARHLWLAAGILTSIQIRTPRDP